MKDARLKPCPFCGGEELFIHSEQSILNRLKEDGSHVPFGFVTCTTCFSMSRTQGGATLNKNEKPEDAAHRVYEDAVEAWNKRYYECKGGTHHHETV